MAAFLNRNQYAIVYSNRCNYSCSYCCTRSGPTSPPSDVESNPDGVCALLDQVDPGVILVGGGEPTLWKDLPDLMDRLPQHRWVILSNLARVPDWLLHPNIVLILPAFHQERAKFDQFTRKLDRLLQAGRRLGIKLIVHPHREMEHLEKWRTWNEMGVPTHFTPLEYTHFFSREFLDFLVEEALTSCLYNSRFFRPDVTNSPRLCFAGTQKMFQLNPSGTIQRCSSRHGFEDAAQPPELAKPWFHEEPKHCDGDGCFCEWHHWSGAALANDNATWTHYVETGEWVRPTQAELREFIRKMQWDPAGRVADRKPLPLLTPSTQPTG
jgi:hypothetical protein